MTTIYYEALRVPAFIKETRVAHLERLGDSLSIALSLKEKTKVILLPVEDVSPLAEGESLVVSSDSLLRAWEANAPKVLRYPISFEKKEGDYWLGGVQLESVAPFSQETLAEVKGDPCFRVRLPHKKATALLKKLTAVSVSDNVCLSGSPDGGMEVALFSQGYFLRLGNIPAEVAGRNQMFIQKGILVESLEVFLHPDRRSDFLELSAFEHSNVISSCCDNGKVCDPTEWLWMDIFLAPAKERITPPDVEGLLSSKEKTQVPVNKDLRSQVRKAIADIKSDVITFKPVSAGIELVGTGVVVPYGGKKPSGSFSVPKVALAALLCSGFQLVALALGIGLPVGIALAKGTFNTVLALATVMEPLEKVAPAEAGAKAKKKTPPQEGSEMSTPDSDSGEIPGVVVTPAPEETLEIAQAIAENAGADDPELKRLIEEAEAAVPEQKEEAEPKATSKKKTKKGKGAQDLPPVTPESEDSVAIKKVESAVVDSTKSSYNITGSPVEEVALRIKALGRYITLRFDFTSALCVSLDVEVI